MMILTLLAAIGTTVAVALLLDTGAGPAFLAGSGIALLLYLALRLVELSERRRN